MKALKKENEFIDDTDLASHRPGGLADIKPLRIEFNIRNQVIGVHPPVESCREHMYNELASWVSVITGLQRIQSQRYQVRRLYIYCAVYLSANVMSSTLEKHSIKEKVKNHKFLLSSVACTTN